MMRLIVALALMLTGMAQAQEAKEPPVRVYLLVGQSNMQGKASIEGSLKKMVTDDPKKEFQFLVEKDGKWRERSDVWIHYDLYPFRELRYGLLKPGYGSSSGQIGPELGFGHAMGDASKGQVLLIKAAWGGKSLGHNFLPPSVGKYTLPVEPNDPGYFYHRVLQLVSEVTQNAERFFPDYKGQGFQIAGLCWHQGWNDQYGGLDVKYEKNMAAFIKDIRSVEHGLGVPGLPVVIATSGMIEKETPIKTGQLAMGDKTKYPEFDGNVAVVDTDKPYGPDQMKFKFAEKVGYHWNGNGASYTNIGRAMAAEMQKLLKPKLPARLAAWGTPEGVQLIWQLGTETPKSVKLLRNGKAFGAELSATQSVFVDANALPGENTYELVFDMPASPQQKLTACCDTSVTRLSAYRSTEGVMLSWKARGKYEGFEIRRDGKVVAANVPADARQFHDKQAPQLGLVKYSIQPTAGKVTPATLVVNRGPVDPGDALIYEPFDYPANPGESQSLIGKGGAPGTKGAYVYLSDTKLDRAPATLAGGLTYGTLPVTGNRGSTGRWSAEAYIELDDSLHKAGLLKDGATLWMSYVFHLREEPEHRNGGGVVTLRSEDMKEGVGFKAGGQYETVVVRDGKVKGVRITGSRKNASILVVGRIVWGKDGADDSFVPFHVGPDLKLPEKHGRAFGAFNIDQSKLSRLVLSGEGQFDEIRVGPTFESVVGGGTPTGAR